MKKGLKISIILSLALIFCFALISCRGGGNEANEPKTEITTSGLNVVDGIYQAVVDVDVETFDLISKIKLADGSKIIFSVSSEFETLIDGAKIALENGENKIYACVIDEYENEQEYIFNIYKKQTFTVTFETNGGSRVEPITVKEGAVIEAPSTVKSGYSFTWDYDFNKPITEDMTVIATWTANAYKITVDLSVINEQVEMDVNYGEEYSIEEFEPTKAGYRFNGWYILTGEGGDVKVPFSAADTYLYADDITVVPELEAIEYSITYVVDNGATNPNNAIKFTVESVIELLDATWMNDERVFDGWFTSSDFSEKSRITEISAITESITLWAKFNDVDFYTSVDCYNGGELVNEFVFKYKSPYSLPSLVPEKGYLFDGWYVGEQKLDLDGTWAFKDTEIELTAKFVARENGIEYELFGGTNNEANINEYSADLGEITLQAPTFGSHIFLGWFTNPEFTDKIEVLSVDTVTDEMTIYAKWKYVSNVTLEFDGGETEDEIASQFIYGESYVLPTPIKAGNLFAGWYINGDKLPLSGTWSYKTDVTVSASWVPTTIVINYVLNGGTQNESNPVSFDVFTGVIELLEPTKDHAVFMGWYRDSKFQSKVESIDTSTEREITLYAKWFDTNITVNYDANGGTVARPTVSLVYGTAYALDTPNRLGYQFDGWFIGENKISQTGTWDILESEVTLVARWSVITYSIDYDLDGFETDGLVTEYTVESPEIVLLPLIRDGYIFLGWENGGVLSQTITIAKGSTGDRSYTASWCKSTDSQGFVYELRGEHMVCVGFVRPVDDDHMKDRQRIFMPSEYFGYPVTAITTNAFTDFGIKFGQSSYKNASYYYTICIPMSITLIEADAFDGCNGICVALYREDKTIIDSFKSADAAELRAWEKGVIYSSGKSNKQVRDCIWGYRPAIGWSRYSAVEIADDYE